MKQAVADYGPPLKTENISAEETRATWLSDSEVFNIFIAPNGSEVVRTSRGTIKAFWVLSGSMGREGHIPDGAPIGTVRSGNIFWYRILTFQENGLLKKSEEKSDIVWAK